MKQILLSVLLLSAMAAHAQNAQEATVKFKKEGQPVAMATYNVPKDIVNNAFLQKLASAGITKKGKENGFASFKGVVWGEMSADKLDVYFKADERKGVTTAYLLLSKGYDNFISKATDSVTMVKMLAFLNSFVNDVNNYVLQQNIAAQEEIVRKANSYYQDAQKDGKSLADDKEKIERKIDQNKTEQEKRKAALDTETTKLETMKSQAAASPSK